MIVLGLWDGHDAGAALLVDGRVQVAVNEERFTRRKLEVRFPTESIAVCLASAGVQARDVARVAISTSDPAKALGRIWPGSKERHYQVRRRLARPGAMSTVTRAMKYRMTEWAPGRFSTALSRQALARTLSRHGLGHAALDLIDHHEAHAAGAAWASGFDSCAVVTIDGLGDGLSSTISRFRDGRLERVAASPAHASLGVFFEHVTSLLNMRELEDEGKVMALADYAAPIDDADNPLLSLIDVRDGVIRTAGRGPALKKTLARLQWRYANEQFAFLAQRAVERVIVALARDAMTLTGESRIALAGGVASNVKATRQVRLRPDVQDVYVFPHMGDGGLPLGTAVASAARRGEPLTVDLTRLDLGPSFDDDAIMAAIRAAGLAPTAAPSLPTRVTELLEADRIVLWFQGGMEYGPRALGHRSVLARPDRIALRDRLNLVLKRRVWYQPFCPSLLESEGPRLLDDWTGSTNRAMTMAFHVAPDFRERLAGVTSIDGTCRPQLVADDDPSAFASLLHEARRRWGVGVVLNTSMNIHGEPLVCTPAQAIDVFLRSGADALAIGPYCLETAATAQAVPSSAVTGATR